MCEVCFENNHSEKYLSPPSILFSPLMDQQLHPAMTVSNIKNFIPITLETETSHYYSTWSELFQAHCRTYQVFDHLSPRTPAPSSDDALWSRLDAIVLRWIYGTISTDLLHTIFSPGQTAHNAWTTLQNHFNDNINTHPTQNIFSRVLCCTWKLMFRRREYNSVVEIGLSTMLFVVNAVMMFTPPGGYSQSGKLIAAYTNPLLFARFMDNAIGCLICGVIAIGLVPSLHRPYNITILGVRILLWLSMSYFLSGLKVASDMDIDTSTSEGLHLQHMYGAKLSNLVMAWEYIFGLIIIGQILMYAWKIRKMVNHAKLE